MKITRHLLFTFCTILAIAGMEKCAAASQEEKPIVLITELKRDITLLNLLNGLHLTAEQQAALLQDARNAQKITNDYERRLNQLSPEFQKDLEDLKSQLLKGELPPESPLEESAKRANHEMKRMRKSYLGDLAVVEKHVSATLTDGQMQIISDFKPCLIPPRNLKNPIRAGQAKDSSGIETMLAKVRTTPDDTYERKVDAMIERRMAKYEERLDPAPTKETHESEKARIRSVFDEARSMTDVDFELNKHELAQKADLQNKGPEGSLLTHGERRGRVSAFLLDERIIPLLEQRIASSGLMKKTTTTALDAINPAEDCRQECGSKR